MVEASHVVKQGYFHGMGALIQLQLLQKRGGALIRGGVLIRVNSVYLKNRKCYVAAIWIAFCVYIVM